VAVAVLTRLPAPHRLAPADAWALVQANFAGPAAIVTLSGPACVALLGRLAARGIGGGRVYDEVIAACAAHAKVDALLTSTPGISTRNLNTSLSSSRYPDWA